MSHCTPTQHNNKGGKMDGIGKKIYNINNNKKTDNGSGFKVVNYYLLKGIFKS
jgi:hypothetical protein